MHEVGFEPTKRNANDLKSLPFDQTREPMLIGYYYPNNNLDKPAFKFFFNEYFFYI